MKNYDSKLSKPKISYNEFCQDSPQKVYTFKDKQIDMSPLKTEESINSARNSKNGSKGTLVGFEPLKSRSFVYSIASPTSATVNLNSFTSYRSTLNMQKLQEKRSGNSNLGESQSIRKILSKNGRSHESSQEKYNNQTNKLLQKDLVITPHAKIPITGQEVPKSTSVLERGSRGSKNNTTFEEVPAQRKNTPNQEYVEANLQPKQIPVACKWNLKQNLKNERTETRGQDFSSSSPHRLYVHGNKLKDVTAKAKNEYLFSYVRSSHVKIHNKTNGDSQNDDRDLYLSTSASQNQKHDSFGKRANGTFTNANSTILGISHTSKRMESRNSKDNSYLKDNSGIKIEERLQSLEKKDIKSSESFKSKLYQRYNQKVDPSFEAINVQSVRSVEFYPSPLPAEDFKLLNKKTMSNSHLEIFNADGKEVNMEADDGGVLGEKSKKNFLNFHRLLTENKRTSLGHEKYHNQLASEFQIGCRSIGEEEENRNLAFFKIKKPQILDSDFSLAEATNFEVATAKITNKKILEAKINLNQNEFDLDSKQVLKVDRSVNEELIYKRYPKTTKSNSYKQIDLSNSLQEKRVGTQSVDPKDYLNESGEKTNFNPVSRSLTMGSTDKAKEIFKRNKKSRTLVSNEIEEKIAQYEIKKVDFSDNSQNNSQLRLKSRNEKGSGAPIVSEEVNTSLKSKQKRLTMEDQLKMLYFKIKEGLERNRIEKDMLILEKKQMAEKIECLEKRLAALEQKIKV